MFHASFSTTCAYLAIRSLISLELIYLFYGTFVNNNHMSLTILNRYINCLFKLFEKSFFAFPELTQCFFLFSIISPKRHLKIVGLISSFTTILSCSARKYKVYGYNKLQTSMSPKYYPKILCLTVGFRLFQMVLCDTNLNKLPKD